MSTQVGELRSDEEKRMIRPALLRAFRQLARLSQDELAKKAGMDRSQISRLENNFRRPSLRERKALSRVLNVPPQILFPESKKRQP
jgi:transcriptional regulator with XRE-family HTH domain